MTIWVPLSLSIGIQLLAYLNIVEPLGAGEAEPVTGQACPDTMPVDHHPAYAACERLTSLFVDKIRRKPRKVRRPDQL